MAADDLPTLRYRAGAVDKEFRAPTTIAGEVRRTDIACVTIAIRGQETNLYLMDLEPVLGGPDKTLGILLDAADHRDHVRIGLARSGITYDNPAQLARFRAAAGAREN